jgi:hypothetical protein
VPIVSAHVIDEFVSHSPLTLSENQAARSLNLPFPSVPIIPWEGDFAQWTHPGEYGAIGDGRTDDTDAIQRTMNSGKRVVYFEPGRYRICRPILIPATVSRINFMFIDLISGEELRGMTDQGMFTISEDAEEPLLIEDLFSFEENFGAHYLINHDSSRTVILRNLHSQSCASYIATGKRGDAYLENVVCTTGIFDDTYQQPCFVFKNQRAWCRQIDPEYTPDKIINDGGQLVVMGFKTEGEGIAVTTKNGGQTEILGGILYFGANNDIPALLNHESDLSVTASTTGFYPAHLFRIAVRQVFDGKVQDAGHERFPIRHGEQYTIPLYAGRKPIDSSE